MFNAQGTYEAVRHPTFWVHALVDVVLLWSHGWNGSTPKLTPCCQSEKHQPSSLHLLIDHMGRTPILKCPLLKAQSTVATCGWRSPKVPDQEWSFSGGVQSESVHTAISMTTQARPSFHTTHSIPSWLASFSQHSMLRSLA